MTYFPAYPAAETPSAHSLALSQLIPGDPQPTLRVPYYPRGEAPSGNYVSASAYVSGVGPLYVIPIASTVAELMSPFARPVSALTPLAGP